ncbi:hypothetical protein [Pseudomonas sp. R1-7]|uniref:hypothetical protein n=1 Tax=Pseudomonas sp. R1-7 TaxID=2817398 RepID=UPI003DA8F676
MNNSIDVRFHAHHLLLELDAATNQMMMLIAGRQAAGHLWDQAAKRQKQAYEAWAVFLYKPAIDPMPSLDGRAEGSYVPSLQDEPVESLIASIHLGSPVPTPANERDV